MTCVSHSGPLSVRRIRRHGGFTLIEVLVVVAIIALLIAILLPSLARVRWQAKSLACRAGLHDLGQAFTMYADQFQGFYPINFDPYVDAYQTLWDAKLLKNPQILACPATRNVVRSGTVRKALTAADYRSVTVNMGDPAGFNVQFVADSDINRKAANAEDGSGGHSYEYNGVYAQDRAAQASQRSPLSQKRKRSNKFVFPPADMLLVHDADEHQSSRPLNGALGCTNSLGSLDSPSQAGNNCPQPWDNHGEKGMNMMFADGHAQWTNKVAGEFKDYTVKPMSLRQDENASIDKIWMKSDQPWAFTGR